MQTPGGGSEDVSRKNGLLPSMEIPLQDHPGKTQGFYEHNGLPTSGQKMMDTSNLV